MKLATASRLVVSAGVDLVDVDRFRLAEHRCGDALLRRVLADPEYVRAGEQADPVGAAATLFGVKEAVIKMLGGMPRGGRFRDITVDPAPAGGGSAASLVVSLQGPLAAVAGPLSVTADSRVVSDRLVLAWSFAAERQPPAAHPSADNGSRP